MRWAAESVARSVLIYLFSAACCCCLPASIWKKKRKMVNRVRNRIVVVLWLELRRAKMF